MNVNPSQTARELIAAYVEQSAGAAPFDVDPRQFDAGRALLEADEETQACAVVESVRRGLAGDDAHFALAPLRKSLLRRKLPYTRSAVNDIIDALQDEPHLQRHDVSVNSLVKIIELHAIEQGSDDLLRDKLQKLAGHLAAISYAEYAKAGARLVKLLETGGAATTAIDWSTDEPWVEKTQALLAELDESSRGHWLALLLHCNGAGGSKPSQKWLKQAQAFIEPIGVDNFTVVTMAILAEIGKPGKTPPARMTGLGDQTDVSLIHDAHGDRLRGLVWCTGLIADDRLTQAVGAAADACFHKLQWIGPRSPKIGNACLIALAQKTDMKAIAELSRLKTRVKHASVKKQLGKSLDAVAGRVGLSADELEEVAVPTCGLTGVGVLEQQLGDVAVRILVEPVGKPTVTYQPAGKKAQASVPASIKETHAESLKALKQNLKELDKLAPAQRIRLERLFLRQAEWNLRDFRTRYLDHPLVGTLARRLIWNFDGRPGIWHDQRIVNVDGAAFEQLSDETRVSLWHPSSAGADEVLAWRNWLAAHAVRQPFKQAHREIYLLTDAERQTRTYSNRFAAHILRQHSFAALCQQRGWGYRLQGAFDSANTPTIELPHFGLRVEFWVEAIDNAELSALHIHLYLSTDQVRFYRGDSVEPLPLEETPPLAFSEMMRDVDLFVGVCSVGNDPNWHEGGPGGRFLDYWRDYSFGDLSANAQTRRAVLERLVPSLQIGPRCSFSDRFLVVEGKLRTYKIHLGSGNILMTPNDQYLCIVPKRGMGSQADRVFLPFEGDELLSIILSKAFLLADDDQISDATKQIKGK